MKSVLKTILVSIVATCSVFTGVTYVSCKADKCSNVVCDNGGSCNGSGKCDCATGFEGTSCETASRNKFIGNWGVVNSSTVTEPAKFGVSVAAGSGNTGVTIGNLHDSLASVTAVVSGDSITIPSQMVQGHVVSGGGYIYSTSAYGVNSNVTMDYSVTDTATRKTVTEHEIWGG